MKATIRNNPEQPERMVYPFLWATEGGCIYLRTVEEKDIIIVPVQPERIGVVANEKWSASTNAWKRRLPKGAVVTLEQT